jgi:hypothetical protein
MSVAELTDDAGATYVTIRPLRHPDAADIRIRIEKETGFVSLGAGRVSRSTTRPGRTCR